MEYGKIIAVTGLPGLFELLASKNDGAIVRSLDDKSTKFVSSRVHNFSHLESIEVFTVRDNVNLVDIFQAMENESGKVPDGKDSATLKKYFEKVFPDLDFERVYSSDLKKMAKWFEILKANNIEIKLTEQPQEEEEEEQQPETPPVAEKAEKEQSAAAPAKKKAKAEPVAEGPAGEKPKKAAAKKKAEPKKEEPVAKKSAGEKAEKSEKEKTAKAPAKKSAPKKK